MLRRWVALVVFTMAMLWSAGGVAFAEEDMPEGCFPWPIGCFGV